MTNTRQILNEMLGTTSSDAGEDACRIVVLALDGLRARKQIRL